MRAFGWARRRPRASLMLALLSLAVIACADLAFDGRLAGLYVLPLALCAAALAPPAPWLMIGACFALHSAAAALGSELPAGASVDAWTWALAFLAPALLVVYMTGALRRSLVREVRQTRVLDGLGTVSTAIAGSLDLDHVLDMALAQAQRLTRADPVSIWLVQGDDLVRAALVTRHPERVPMGVSPGEAGTASPRVARHSGHLLARSVERGEMLVAAAAPGYGSAPEAAAMGVGAGQVLAAIPLVARGAVRGVLAAGLKEEDPEWLRVLCELANSSAVAIENARLYAAARRNVEDLERLRAQAERSERRARFLAEAGRIFNATLDAQATMESVVTKATEVLGDACLILQVVPESPEVRIAAIYENGRCARRGLKTYLASHPVRVGEGILGKAVADGVPLLARGEPDNPGQLGPLARHLGIRAMIIVPLRLRHRLTGLLASAYVEESAVPSEEDLRLASLLADRAALAIENAALFEETRQARQALEAWSHELERRVEEKTQELAAAHRDLIRAARLASIGQLSATVAHELRNPLNVIKSAHYALAAGCTGERAARYLDAVARQVDSASRIVTALLEFAQDSPPSLRPADLNAIVQGTLLATPLPPGIRLVSEPDLGPLVVEADAAQIRRALGHLLDNAIQAMPAGGVLRVSTARQGEFAAVRVSDTGPGIPAHVRPRIFDPLFSTRTKGAGLGLAITQRIAEIHDGGIEVESEPGAGAVFAFTLPMSDAVGEELPQSG